VFRYRPVPEARGHIDHVGGLLYYLAHRHLRAAPAVVLCHPLLRQPIETLMDASAGMAGERTAYRLVAIDHDETFDLGEDLRLRAFRTLHTVPSLGYVLLRGDEPLLCYTGDTAWGIHFQREDVQRARVLVTECTFWDPAHRATAHRTGHLHLGDIVSLLELVGAEAVVLTHVPRQLDLQRTRKLLDVAIPPRHRHRLHVMLRP
jgi:ribonuclease Z